MFVSFLHHSLCEDEVRNDMPSGDGRLQSLEAFHFLDKQPYAQRTALIKSPNRGRTNSFGRGDRETLHSPDGMISRPCREPINLHPKDKSNFMKWHEVPPEMEVSQGTGVPAEWCSQNPRPGPWKERVTEFFAKET